MKTAHAVGLLAVAVLALAGCDRGADKQASQGRYDPRRTFAPLTLPVAVNSYRAGDGAPGPDYWQNRADYKIAATLDPVKATLTGDEVITYTNNSPTALTALWVQL
ncbi:MAG: M1 family peptidase, partial [Proteobacteria bacterium]|nr:M1 family peptidase [Pseudomonadota bacterium]